MKKLKLLTISIVAIGSLALLIGVYYSGKVEGWRPVSFVQVGDLYSETNKRRTDAGLPPLELNENLNKSAAIKCNDMVTRNYWGHDSPDGKKPWDFIKPFTQYKEAGENLAKSLSSAKIATDAWMNSETHKANLLKPTFTDVGYAVCGDHIVQHFIAK